jgi:hypothetical protein
MADQPTHDQGLAGLAPVLAPALVEACEGRLAEIHWFKSDWQRGGAATGYARFEVDTPSGRERRDVVVKLPVGPTELRFTVALSATPAPTPRVLAHGESVGGYDLGWMVIERLPGDPLAAEKHEDVFHELTTAAASFQKHAGEACPDRPQPREVFDWAALTDRARQMIHDSDIHEKHRWKEAVKAVQKALPRLVGKWRARPITGWCHGDLHPGNAMRRGEGTPWGAPGCVLLDLAEVHTGHWVEDAVYLERLYWAKPEALHGLKPVKMLAAARRAIGLDNGEHAGELANVRRVLMGSIAPAFIQIEGHPKYLHAALEIVERLLPEAAH